MYLNRQHSFGEPGRGGPMVQAQSQGVGVALANIAEQAGSSVMTLLSDDAFMQRLLGTSEDCVSALRSLQLPDSFWTDEFKVVPCQKTTAHKWTLCPCAHAGETARRRCPKSCNYKPVLCPLVKAKKTCPLGDACSYAHNVFEHWLHPARYKTRLCSFGRNCNRAICFFAHSADELRCPPNVDDNKEADEREYLVQLLMAQESGLLPQNSFQQQLQAQAAAAAAAAGVPTAMQQAVAAAGLDLMASGLPPLPAPRMVPQRMAMSARSSLSGVPDHANLLLGMPGGAAAMERALSQQQEAHHGASLAAAAMERVLTQSQSLNSAALERALHNSSSVNSVQSEPGLPPNAAAMSSLEALANSVHPHAGRLSDPGTTHLQIPAHVSTINPIPHMNRVSDSGNTLGMLSMANKANLAGLESILPLVNSALATGQLSLPNAAVAAAAAAAAAASRHHQQQQQRAQPGSAPAGATGNINISPVGSPTHSGSMTPPSPPMPARRSMPGNMSLPGMPAMAQNGALENGHGHGQDCPDSGARAASPIGNGGDLSLANISAAVAAAAASQPSDPKHINALVARLQEQGLNKDQLVASLSQLLAQLLSVGN